MWWVVGISGLLCFNSGTWIIIGRPTLHGDFPECVEVYPDETPWSSAGDLV